MVEIPKVARRHLLEWGGFTARMYIFDWVETPDAGIERMTQDLKKFGVTAKRDFAITFAYQYSGKNRKQVFGEDIIALRNPSSEFSMIDTLTIENGVALPRDAIRTKKGGTVCSVEVAIIGSEELFRAACIERPKYGFEHFRTKFPVIHPRYVHQSLACLADPYRPFDYDLRMRQFQEEAEFDRD